MQLKSVKLIMKSLVVGTGVALFLNASSLAQSPMNKGGWLLRTTMTQVSADKSAESLIGDTTERVCMTEAFLSSNPYLNPYKITQGKSPPDCSFFNHVAKNSTASWNMACRVGDNRSSRATVSVEASSERMTALTFLDAMQGETHVSSMRVRVSATYLGNCTPEMEILPP